MAMKGELYNSPAFVWRLPQAARELGISDRQLRRWLHGNNPPPASKIAGTWFFVPNRVRDWVIKQEVKGG